MAIPVRLKTRLTILVPGHEGGGSSVSRMAQPAIWAAMLPASSSWKGIEASYFRILLDASYNLTLQHYFADGPRTYRIVSIRDIHDHRFVEVHAAIAR